jgi:hypothetical protein
MDNETNIEPVKNKINRNPSNEEIMNNVHLVIQLMSKGFTDVLDIKNALAETGIFWSRNKVLGYIRAANAWIDKSAADIKAYVDQRHILVKKSEAVEQTLWTEMEKLSRTRNETVRKLNSGLQPAQLNWEETQIADLDIEKFHNILIKGFQIILKAQERQSELYGYKNDKTILIKRDKGQKLQYEDSFNEDLIKKYRNLNENDMEGVIDEEIIEETQEDQEAEDKFIDNLGDIIHDDE